MCSGSTSGFAGSATQVNAPALCNQLTISAAKQHKTHIANCSEQQACNTILAAHHNHILWGCINIDCSAHRYTQLVYAHLLQMALLGGCWSLGARCSCLKGLKHTGAVAALSRIISARPGQVLISWPGVHCSDHPLRELQDLQPLLDPAPSSPT